MEQLVEHNHGEPVFDLKVRFTDQLAAAALLAYKSKGDIAHNGAALEQLLALHTGQGAVLAMRSTRGPTSGAIGWHFDGGYAYCTVQLSLNDDAEYEGDLLLLNGI